MAVAQHEGKHFNLDIVKHVQHEWRQPRRLQESFQHWVTTQPPILEVAVATIAGSGQGAFLGGLMGVFTKLDPNTTKQISNQPGANQDVVKQMQMFQTGGPWKQARNFAVMTGVNAGLAMAIKKFRKKDDVYTTMMAAFGSGAAFSLVSGMAGANALQGAFTTGVVFAIFQGGFQQLGKTFGGGGAGDALEYARGRYLLQTLGLQKYEKKLSKGQLTDNTIMLWNDRALQESGIPPGPRLLILHHLDQCKHILKPGMPIPGLPPLPPKNSPAPPASKR